jgi:hypothetical protein
MAFLGPLLLLISLKSAALHKARRGFYESVSAVLSALAAGLHKYVRRLGIGFDLGIGLGGLVKRLRS